MSSNTTSKRLNAGAALLWAALSVGAAACSEDKTETDASTMPGRNKCISPGTGGDCMCGPGSRGTNTCGADGYWTTCQCASRPDGAICDESVQLRCSVVCPGESAARITRCVNGTYDCSCADAGPTTLKRDAGS